MASRWRALHRRKARKFQPTCDPWQPSGWESIYSLSDNFLLRQTAPTAHGRKEKAR